MSFEPGENEVSEDAPGVQLIRKKGSETIVAAVFFPGLEYRVGQRVVSKGRILVDEGIQGTVVAVHQPYGGIRTSDILEIHFDGRRTTHFMKQKDLEVPK